MSWASGSAIQTAGVMTLLRVNALSRQKARHLNGSHTPEFKAASHQCDVQISYARYQDLLGVIPHWPTADTSLDTAMCMKELEPQASLSRMRISARRSGYLLAVRSLSRAAVALRALERCCSVGMSSRRQSGSVSCICSDTSADALSCSTSSACTMSFTCRQKFISPYACVHLLPSAVPGMLVTIRPKSKHAFRLINLQHCNTITPWLASTATWSE